jgi:hypothetical protein
MSEYVFEKEIFEKLGNLHDHPTVEEALEYFWTLVETKELTDNPSHIICNRVREQDSEALEFGASWIYQAHVEDPDPDFSYQEIQIALWVDLTENVFNGQIIESIEFGTGSVSELFEEEEEYDDEEE